MKHKRFKQVKDGEWIRPKMKNHLLACCDCGLVHRMNFKVIDGEVVFQAFRAPKHTKLRREKTLNKKFIVE